MGKKKRSSKNVIRGLLINFIKLIVLLIVTPPIAFVVTIIILDYNPLTLKLNAYARVTQMSEWELPPNSTLLSFETQELLTNSECSLAGTLSIESSLTEDEFEAYYQSTHFETYKYSFREFWVMPQLKASNGNSIYKITAIRYWKC